MSINLQKCLKERAKFGSSPGLPYRHSKQAFVEKVYSDKYLISQLTCERELSGHIGCVNTLDWSLEGDKLLSGSDDKKLNIYKPFEDYKISTEIDTGHRANIFSAKFMPQTSDNIIISGAGDSEIHIFDLQRTDSPLHAMYVCHSDQVKKICVYDDNPNEFLTCSQDGTVRRFDIREPHICSPHSVRTFLTARKRPSKQYPIPDDPHARNGCPNPILDYGRYNTELNSMTINKLFPHYFAVAGTNDYIYLHDRRMLPSHYTEFGHYDPMNTLKCIKRFSPTLDGLTRPNKHITACKFSDSNGHELIGSWSSDDIYLFNINDLPVQLLSRNTLTTNTKRKTTGDNSEDNASTNESTDEDTDDTTTNRENRNAKSLWEITVHDFLTNNLTSAMSFIDELLEYIESCDILAINDAELLKTCAYFVRASILIYQLQECNLPQVTNHEINETIEKAKSSAPYGWKGSWCKAIGYWILAGGAKNNGQLERGVYLHESLQHATVAKTMFEEYVWNRNARPSSSTTSDIATDTLLRDEDYMQMIYAFLRDIELACTEYLEDTHSMEIEQDVETEEREEQYKWLNFIFLPIVDSNMMIAHNLNQPLSTTNQTSSNNETQQTDASSSSDTASENREERDENIVPMEEDEESLYTQIMSRQIMDIYRRGDDIDSDEEDSDFDLETINILHENTRYPSFDTDVGVVKPRMRYSGHCNIETVKDVEFFGLRDEYILSGSDRGYVFMWEKKTGKIVQILQGDEDVVNVTKGHPFLPIMAVSGIDTTVKIFQPTSRLSTTSSILEPKNPNSYSTSSRLHEQEEIVSTHAESNRDISDDVYMTRSVYAAFMRMERQRRLLVVNNIIDEDEGGFDSALAALEEYESSDSEESL